MTIDPDPVGPGQESVWAFPRPSIAQPSAHYLLIEHRGQVVAETRRAIRTIETSHPPTYFIPSEDVQAVVTRSARAGSLCEWKGSAVYLDITIAGVVMREAAWSYPAPTAAFAAIAGHLAFYATPLRRLFCRRRTPRPQPGGFYGGWITSDLAGPFKGVPGIQFW